MTIQDIMGSLAEPLHQVVQRCRELVRSSVPYIQEMADHISENPGKMLRPLMVFLAAKADQATPSLRQQSVDLALCVELVHMATLVHDDVIDDADLRRGVATLHQTHGKTAAILFGDFLFSNAFVILATLQNTELLRVLSSATAEVCEGEILQSTYRHKLLITRKSYLKLVESKTAALLGAACRLGAVLGGQPNEQAALLESFGRDLGRAFQIYDDYLDYHASSQTLGKPALSDLRNGFLTLPIIDLIEKRREDHPQEIFELISHVQQGGSADELMALLQAHRCLDACLELAQRYLQSARETLAKVSDAGIRRNLQSLPEFVIGRDY